MKKLFIGFFISLLFLQANADDEVLICPMIYSPVCGSDGQNYANSCMASKVGIKYNGTCLSIISEYKYKESWDKIYDKYSLKLDEGNKVILFNKLIDKIDSVISDTDFETKNYSILSYLRYLIIDTLQTDVYEEKIKDDISNLSPVLPVSGGNWLVTNFTWIDENTVLVDYNDGNSYLNLKVGIEVNGDDLIVSSLETFLDIEHTYDNKDFVLTFKIPTDWTGKYSYKFLDDQTLQFIYNSKEGDDMLFNINFNKKSDFEEESNNYKLKEVGDYVISYSSSLDMPYTEEDDINTYSSMIDQVSDILDRLIVEIK